ncbi:MAG: hypothetical protein ABEK42_12000, partial [Thiohalorhabdaceae bacterium]
PTSRAGYETLVTECLGGLDRPGELPPYTAWSGASRLAVLGEGEQAREAHAAMGEAYREHRKPPSQGGYPAAQKAV